MNPRARLRRIIAEQTKRVSSTPKNDNLNSQREIHHGTTPATTQGTNTKKMAVPMTAAVLRMDTIRSLLFLRSALEARRARLRSFSTESASFAHHLMSDYPESYPIVAYTRNDAMDHYWRDRRPSGVCLLRPDPLGDVELRSAAECIVAQMRI
jgi:hypothetical protein